MNAEPNGPALSLPKGHSAVRAMKRPALAGPKGEAMELFCTPPWATRALFENVLPCVGYALDVREDRGVNLGRLWDPCAGLGHMVEVFREYSGCVSSSDIFCHPLEGGGDASQFGVEQVDFLDELARTADWIITNPPFSTAESFLAPALRLARCGVAFLERIQWLEGGGRYKNIFVSRPPSLIAPFAERVPMCEGGYDPEGSTATMYAWFIWAKNCNGCLAAPLRPRDTLSTYLIPPGRKEALLKPSDRALAARCVPGFIPPSLKRKVAKERMAVDANAALEVGAAACV